MSLLPHQKNRREAAWRTIQAKRLDLTDPLFNLREIAKQFLLLEDHLLHPSKICPDCIRKHLLTIEALGEEGTSLDREGKYQELCEAIAEKARGWLEEIADSHLLSDIGQEIREIRKNLVPIVHDPRGVDRVASLYIHRSHHCCN